MSIKAKKFVREHMKTIMMHIACWSLFILYELGAVFYYSGKLEPVSVYVCHYTINISFFYGCLYILTILSGSVLKRLISGLGYYMLLFTGYFLLKFSIEYFLEAYGSGFFKELSVVRKNVIVSASRGIYFTMLAMFYWLAGHVATYRKKAADAERLKMASLRDKAELEARLAEARNAYLQQQLSPHLLFNALNFIYSSVYKHSPEASRCVLLLSDIMRTSLEENGPDGKVMLTEEIAQLRRLEEINRFRYDHELYFDMATEGDLDRCRIIPLILFTLVENVFKHGDLGDKQHPAHVLITVDKAGVLRFSSRNAIRQKPKGANRSQTGLQNVRVRLDFAYPFAYQLDAGETAGLFELNLTLPL